MESQPFELKQREIRERVQEHLKDGRVQAKWTSQLDTLYRCREAEEHLKEREDAVEKQERAVCMKTADISGRRDGTWYCAFTNMTAENEYHEPPVNFGYCTHPNMEKMDVPMYARVHAHRRQS